jgi:hypothetical protein
MFTMPERPFRVPTLHSAALDWLQICARSVRATYSGTSNPCPQQYIPPQVDRVSGTKYRTNTRIRNDGGAPFRPSGTLWGP